MRQSLEKALYILLGQLIKLQKAQTENQEAWGHKMSGVS